MSVLLINSSFRNNGNTALVLESLRDGLAASGPGSDSLNIAHQDIKPCRGCRICFDRGENSCPLQDGFREVRDEILAHEATVFASPIYVEDVNGAMKNLIDRMAYNCHRPGLHGRSAFVITTSGAGSSKHGIRTMERASLTWGFTLVGAARFRMGARMDEASFDEAYGAEVLSIASRIAEAARTGPRPSFTELMAFGIQKRYYLTRADRSSIDYLYWRDSGWLDKGRDYYSETDIGAVRKALSRLAGNAVSAIVLK